MFNEFGCTRSEGDLKIDCSETKVAKEATITANNQFNFAGKVLENAGSMKFKTFATLTMVEFDNKGIIKLPETTYLQAKSAIFDTNSQLKWRKNADATTDAQPFTRVMRIDEKVKIKENAHFHLDDVHFTAEKVSVRGEFTAEKSAIHVMPPAGKPAPQKQTPSTSGKRVPIKPIKSITTKGKAKFDIKKSYIRAKVVIANSSETAVLDSATLDTTILRVNSPINITSTTINSQSCDFDKKTQIEKSKITNIENLSIKLNAMAKIEDSHINTKSLIVNGKLDASGKMSADGKYVKGAQTDIISKSVTVNGEFALTHSILQSDMLIGDKNSTLKSQNSTSWVVSDSALLYGKSTFKTSSLNLNNFSNYGDTTVESSRVISNNTVYSANKLTVNGADVTAPRLDLGGEYQIDKLQTVDKEGKLTQVTSLLQSGQGSIKNSHIDAKYFQTSEQATVTYENNPYLKLDNGFLAGKVSFKNSVVKMKTLQQNKSNLSIDACKTFRVESLSSSSDSKTNISQSVILGKMANFEGDTDVNTSSTLAGENVYLSGETKINKASVVADSHMAFLGKKTAIAAASLQAKKMDINNDF
ncbi:MAG: hypothetical protein ACK4PR_11880, partial [Gammaproteobacteria bacterium]